jgi:hypothetical protein
MKPDPYWVERLKHPLGFMEYLEHFDVDLTEETWYKYPEINQMLFDYDPAEITQGFTDLYLNGIMNEDGMRVKPHVHAMEEYLEEFEIEIDELHTVTNEMWVDKLKRDTLEYIKTVLDPKYQHWSTSYAKSEDNMRVDLGLCISRDPIFVE